MATPGKQSVVSIASSQDIEIQDKKEDKGGYYSSNSVTPQKEDCYLDQVKRDVELQPSVQEKSSEPAKFTFDPQPEQNNTLTAYQEFLAKKKAMQQQQEKPAESSFKHQGSSKYKGKKPLLDKGPGFDKVYDEPKPRTSSYGYGELPKPESPNFRDSSFYNPKPLAVFAPDERSSELERNARSMFRDRVDSDSYPKPSIHQSPTKKASDIYQMLKETSEQNKYQDSYKEQKSYEPQHYEEQKSYEQEPYRQHKTYEDNPYLDQEQYKEKKPYEEEHYIEKKGYEEDHYRDQPSYEEEHYREPRRASFYDEDPADAPMEPVNYHRDNFYNKVNEQYKPPTPKYMKYLSVGVKIFREIVFKKMDSAMKSINPEHLRNLRTELHNFKTDTIYDEMSMKLDKYQFRNKTADDLAKTLDDKDIRLNSLNIGCSERLSEAKLTCVFDDNQTAVESFIKGFKTADLFPAFEQLQMIVEFHAKNRYKLSICQNAIKKYILNTRKPIIEKQYFALWMKEVYGLSLDEITTPSISQPTLFEDKESVIQTKLFALVCLFYNLQPSDVFNLQLYTVVYLKPYFCFKSHCGKYFMVLPDAYSNYMNKVIRDTKTCEMKSCSHSIKNDFVRTFCYHSQNLIFDSLR